MFVTNWISTTKIQKISEITNFFRHYFLSRTEVTINRDVSSLFLRTENWTPYIVILRMAFVLSVGQYRRADAT